MKTKITVAAIGLALLAGSTLAKAEGPLNFFNSVPHAERHADNRDRHFAPYRGWHQEYRGFVRHDDHQRDRHRFEARRDYQRDDHPSFAWHRYDRDGR